MPELQNIIENLKKKEQVDAVFLTGSRGVTKKSYSDIDLIIILKENTVRIESVYTWINDTFADIFFFDHNDLKEIENAPWLPTNKMIGNLFSWLKDGDIEFDKSGELTKLQSKTKELKIDRADKENYWWNINYNFETNTRYFKSKDPLYHEALELRLLYSVSQLISGYFAFRDIPWRGEKNAIKYLKEKDMTFYEYFVRYSKSSVLKDKFEYYEQMVKYVFVSEYSLWSREKTYAKLKDLNAGKDEPELVKYWKNLIS